MAIGQRSLTAAAGQMVDHYRILSLLGSGGMGDVFLAREYASERTVAIKFLRSPGNPVAVERFLAEVRALARLDHPNIVRFFATESRQAGSVCRYRECGAGGGRQVRWQR